MSLEIPWVEKYRPKSFEEIVSQNIVINSLREFLKTPNMPHMIFTGPAGTGKTSTALIIAQNYLGAKDLDINLLELNASDTVRMDYVRNVLKDFVNQNMIVGENPLKIVILDEADNIPGQVQQALRRIIEQASSNVKFILLCNYINRIIDPIISRCAVFRFVNLAKESIVKRLKFIAKKEKLNIALEKSEEFFNLLYFISGGDLRKAINTLQMSVSLELLENLDLDEILKISGFLDKKTLNDIINALKKKNFIEAREIVDRIESLDSRNFIRQLLEVIPTFKIEPEKIIEIRSYIGEIDYRISQGADENVQVSALLATILENIKP